ncbi:MAG: Uncharacterized protein CEN89_331 [Candidatus Berkelbacteria bacterium Licking1014_7]|uniref:Probable lipid II flippase MurJ n=1 Tax=Candidatus Berkelbacteria bacterium Licking1014_7 TaxID=2017147 RepID=A0A554LJA4_9BACT|nr:MAG: Uncharacterized protein CEN89_331 [Candidatus Berkelbacteria bacterium Licking1014_7]
MFKFLNKFRGENSVSGATKFLVATLFLSNVLGVIRDHFLAQKIPTTLLDTYYAGFRLPDLIFNVLILGAISAAFIPIFTGLVSAGKKQRAFEVANKVFNLGLIFVLISIAALFLLMPILVKIYVPDFVLEKQEITIKLARWFLLSPLLFSISYLFSGILNSFKHFVVTALAPLFYNLSIIIFTLFLADRVGVFAPAYGVVFGALLHLGVQLPSVVKRGWRYRIIIDIKDQTVRKILKLMLPRSVGLGATQIMLIGFTAIASGLGGGSVAIYNLSDNIQTMPMVIFGISIAQAAFPYLSECFSVKKNKSFACLLENAILMVMYFLIPLTAVFILLRAQIVRIILGSGHFGWEQTILTADTLAIFSLSLLFSGLVPLLARAFYARENTKIPTIVGLATVLIVLVLGWVLARFYGVLGLAGAISIGSFFNAITLFIILIYQKVQISVLRLLKNFSKILLASVLSAIFLQIAKVFYGSVIDLDRFVEVFGQFAIAIGIWLISYWAFSKLLKIDKFQLNIFQNYENFPTK